MDASRPSRTIKVRCDLASALIRSSLSSAFTTNDIYLYMIGFEKDLEHKHTKNKGTDKRKKALAQERARQDKIRTKKKKQADAKAREKKGQDRARAKKKSTRREL